MYAASSSPVTANEAASDAFPELRSALGTSSSNTEQAAVAASGSVGDPSSVGAVASTTGVSCSDVELGVAPAFRALHAPSSETVTTISNPPRRTLFAIGLRRPSLPNSGTTRYPSCRTPSVAIGLTRPSTEITTVTATTRVCRVATVGNTIAVGRSSRSFPPPGNRSAVFRPA